MSFLVCWIVLARQCSWGCRIADLAIKASAPFRHPSLKGHTLASLNMSGPIVPTPAPYVDAQNQAFEDEVAKALDGQDPTTLSLQDLRRSIEKVQKPEPHHPEVNVQHVEVPTRHGKVKTFLLKPKNMPANVHLPFIYHIHGGAWIFGDEFAWSGFLFELVVSEDLVWTGVVTCFG
jgi:acetyl esterase/lipase